MADVTTKVTPIVALDVGTAAEARTLIESLGDLCRFYKVGSELYTAEGPAVVRMVRDLGAEVFLDLKFHDIPNTVRGSVRSAAKLGVRLLTVHSQGGRAMLEAAAAEARETGSDCQVLAVTVLTSMDEESVASVWGRPVDGMEVEVLRLAGIAHEAGVHGVVCGGPEAASVRARFGPGFATLVPGVRLAGGPSQDQRRVVTPRLAAEAGARYIVIGRTVTSAQSPRSAMSAVLADLP